MRRKCSKKGGPSNNMLNVSPSHVANMSTDITSSFPKVTFGGKVGGSKGRRW